MKEKTEALKQASYKIAEELYKQQGAQQGAGAAPGGEGAGPGMGGFNPGAGGFNPNAGGSGPANNGNNTKGAEDADYEVVNDK